MSTTIIKEKLPHTTLFKFVLIRVLGPIGYCKVTAFIDEGSTVSLIEEGIAESLGIKGTKSHMTLKWIGNKSTTEMWQLINLEIQESATESEIFNIKKVRTSQDLNLPEF